MSQQQIQVGQDWFALQADDGDAMRHALGEYSHAHVPTLSAFFICMPVLYKNFDRLDWLTERPVCSSS